MSWKFQSTLPYAGSDLAQEGRYNILGIFQSTLPYAGSDEDTGLHGGAAIFQSTLPYAGSDREKENPVNV